MGKRWLWNGLAAGIILVGLASARRHELLHASIETLASLASGYSVTMGDQRIGWEHAALTGVHVSRAGTPLLDARRIDVRYSLRDLLPGSTHRFGLVALDIDGAKVTIVRFRDGSYNFAGPSKPSGFPQARIPQYTNGVPIRVQLRMHDAALELREPDAYDPSAKAIGVSRFNVDASIDSAARTHYV
ncbi:MAG: hypothetical protein JOY69_03365, partial [Candidatus Eremiobacteraeota bacterium]|nr:hypothetical protein [Candidatus Eremiobacteraeota bacterium]